MSGYFTNDDIVAMEKRRRTAFINSLSGFKSVSLIGTVAASGQSNLSIFSSVTHLGSNPALIGIVSRPGGRHSLQNILETGCFTINHIHPAVVKQAHQTSARYAPEVSEFDATGLTPEYHALLPAPYVSESVIKYGLSLVESHELKINGTTLVIGKVVEVFVPPACLLADGTIDLEAAATITSAGLDSYHTTSRITRLTYAKPNQLPQDMP
ncbi:MAG: flavin reductase [Chitinophagales bacterium]